MGLKISFDKNETYDYFVISKNNHKWNETSERKIHDQIIKDVDIITILPSETESTPDAANNSRNEKGSGRKRRSSTTKQGILVYFEYFRSSHF